MNTWKYYHQLFRYLAKFLGIFCLLFYGTELIIGLSSPENHYSPFVARYLDFVSPYCDFLLHSTKGLLALLGYSTEFKSRVILTVVGGKGIHLAFSCIGYGVVSFWIAFVLANGAPSLKRLGWMIGGSLLLCVINILRLSLVLLAENKGWPSPLGWDHHTWFNIATYAVIFFMMALLDRSDKKEEVRDVRNNERLLTSTTTVG